MFRVKIKNKVYSDSSVYMQKLIRRIDLSHCRRLAKLGYLLSVVRGRNFQFSRFVEVVK